MTNHTQTTSSAPGEQLSETTSGYQFEREKQKQSTLRQLQELKHAIALTQQ